MSNITSFRLPQIIVLPLLLLNSCLLSYVTEPDELARNQGEKADSFLQACNRKDKSCGKSSLPKHQRGRYQSTAYLTKTSQLDVMLNSPNAAIRTQAVTEAGVNRPVDPAVVSKIEKMALSDSSKWVRRAAVKTVAKISGSQARLTLKQAQKDRDKWVRHSATEALASIKR